MAERTAAPSPRLLAYWFDYSCPFAYLGSTQVEALAARTGASLSWCPMLLGGVFAARGTPQNLSNVLSPAKARHNMLDMQRWADLFSVTLVMPPEHPMRTVEALRATLLTGCDPRVIHGFYEAYWVRGEQPSAQATIERVLASASFDPGPVLARLGNAAVKEDLRRRTDRAIELGIFGAPAYVVGDQMFWGQDRAHFAEVALGSPPTPYFTPGATPSPSPSEPRTTMSKTLEIYFDFSSPFAYLGSTQAEALASRTGATLVWRPMLLGGLFRSIGQVDVPLAQFSQAKQDHVMKDLYRWADFWGVPFRFPSKFPMSTVKALRVFIALPDDRKVAFLHRTFKAYWAEDRDINDDATLRELIGEGADDVLSRTQSPEVKQALIAATDGAVKAGVFGAPTWVVDGKELFWGQDRVSLVERELLKR